MSPVPRTPPAALLLGVLAGVVGCDDRSDDGRASLLAAVERFRAVDEAAQPDLAANLARLPCQARVCEAKERCLRYVEPLSRANELKRAVQGSMRRLLPDSEPAAAAELEPSDRAELSELPAKLEQARRHLAEAEAALPACDAALLALRAHRIER